MSRLDVQKGAGGGATTRATNVQENGQLKKQGILPSFPPFARPKYPHDPITFFGANPKTRYLQDSGGRVVIDQIRTCTLRSGYMVKGFFLLK